MKKQILILAIASLVTGMTMSSCATEGCTNEKATNFDSDAEKDDDSCEFDTEMPIITVNKPTPGMYMIDSTGILMMPITIDFEVSDNEQLKSVEFNLHYVNNNDSLLMTYSKDLTKETSPFKVSTSYINTEAIYPLSMTHQNHEIIIKVEDVMGNVKTDTATFFIHYMG